MDERGGPYVRVEPKRSFDKVPIQIDWHDYVARLWRPGAAFATGTRIRPSRSRATGLQYNASVGGVTGSRPPVFPKVSGATVVDGSVTWTAEAVSSASLRTTIADDEWPTVDGVSLSDEQSGDFVYEIMVDGGTSGQEYEIAHQVTLANGEEKEGVVVLPVQD